MKKLLLILCITFGLQAMAKPYYLFKMKTPLTYCEGSVEMWLNNSGPAGNPNNSYYGQNDFIVYEIYDQANNLVQNITIDASTTNDSRTFSQNLAPGTYCAYGGNFSTPTSSLTFLTPICFQIVAAPTFSLSHDGNICVGDQACFQVNGSNNLSYNITSYHYGSAGASVDFNQSPYCPSYNSPGTFSVTFVVESNCGTQTITDEITVENCEDCSIDAGFSFTNFDCYTYSFSANATPNNHTTVSEIWVINGQITEPYQDMDLGPGTHQICRSVIGYVNSEPNNTCCDQYCVDIVIPEPKIENIESNICLNTWYTASFGPAFEVSDFYYYTIGDGSLVDYSSNITAVPNLINPYLVSIGTYTYTYYNEFGCPIKIQNITFNEAPLIFDNVIETIDFTFCEMTGSNGVWVTLCDYFQPMPSDFYYEISDPNPSDWYDYSYNSDEGSATYGNNGCISHFLIEGSYEVTYIDRSTCTVKTYIFNVTRDCEGLIFGKGFNSNQESNTSDNFDSKENFKITPNPVSSSFSITTLSNQDVNIEEVIILNMDGKTVKSFKNVSFNDKINIENLPVGIYFVKGFSPSKNDKAYFIEELVKQ